jgi:PAS domain S-box-containing protein
MIKWTIRWLVVGWLLVASGMIFALEEVKIGILAHRPKPQVQAQWAPLADALNKTFPTHRFAVKALGFDEMSSAVASRQVDFILSNPGHYVLMASHSGLSAPLATLVNLERGAPVTAFGGVIFTRAGQANIRRLEDVRGKSVAITSTDSLGGYQMQAYEYLQGGMMLSKMAHILPIGMPHDKVVDAVLRGDADVGMVRSGVLESLAAEGRLDISKVAIINRQNLPGFPVAVSTRLYPEWLFAAMPHADKDLSRKVVSFLLNVEENLALTRALGIHGFDVPSDYAAVTTLLTELRMPPFDRTPAFSAIDVWKRYQWQIVLGIAVTGSLLALGFSLLLVNRRLRIEKERVQQQSETLKASELRFRTVANYTHDWEYWQGPDHQILFMSPSCERITGYSRDEFTRDPSLLKRIVYPDDLSLVLNHLQVARNLDECEEIQFRIMRRDGEVRWISHVCQDVFDDAGQKNGRRVSNRDITERQRADEELRTSEAKLSSILDGVDACIYLKDMQGRYLFANRAVRELWQTEMNDIIGFGDEKFFDAATAAAIRVNDRRVLDDGEILKTEEVNTLAGTTSSVTYQSTKLPLRRPDGSIYALCGISTDISEIRQTQVALRSSLKEKVALLHEVHHRVKNNLQVITSLLRLEARRSDQPDTTAVLTDMQGRIRSMALLHESLYRSGIFASVELSIYLRELATQAFRAQITFSGSTQLQLDLHPVQVSMDQATPCGLLVNELISNCLKHGFPQGHPGEVRVELRTLPATGGDITQVRLCVSDTGIGLPADFESRRGNSLGLQLVSDLTQQLGGSLEIGPGPGAVFTVTFGVTEPARSSLTTHAAVNTSVTS